MAERNKISRFFDPPTMITIILVILSFATNWSRTQTIQEDITRRVEIVEKKADHINTIENDVKWIKEFLQKKYGIL